MARPRTKPCRRSMVSTWTGWNAAWRSLHRCCTARRKLAADPAPHADRSADVRADWCRSARRGRVCPRRSHPGRRRRYSHRHAGSRTARRDPAASAQQPGIRTGSLITLLKIGLACLVIAVLLVGLAIFLIVRQPEQEAKMKLTRKFFSFLLVMLFLLLACQVSGTATPAGSTARCPTRRLRRRRWNLPPMSARKTACASITRLAGRPNPPRRASQSLVVFLSPDQSVQSDLLRLPGSNRAIRPNPSPVRWPAALLQGLTEYLHPE